MGEQLILIAIITVSVVTSMAVGYIIGAGTMLERLKKAKGALLLLNDFLWYESVPHSYKSLIVKKLKENYVLVDKDWEDHCDDC